MNKTTIGATAGAGALALILVGGAVASAHTPALSCTSDTIHLSLTNYSGGHVIATFDGSTAVNEDFGNSFVHDYAIDTTIDHTYTVTVVGNDGQGDLATSGTTSSLCGYTVTPPVTETPTPTPEPTTPTPTEEPSSTPIPEPSSGPSSNPSEPSTPTPEPSAPAPSQTPSTPSPSPSAKPTSKPSAQPSAPVPATAPRTSPSSGVNPAPPATHVDLPVVSG